LVRPLCPRQTYANAFYDHRMKNMRRVAQRLRDEKDLFLKLKLDHYDAEELEEAMRAKGMLEPRPGAGAGAGAGGNETAAPEPAAAAATASTQAQAEHAKHMASAVESIKEIAATVLQAGAQQQAVAPVVVPQGPDLATMEQLRELRKSVAGMSSRLVEISKDEQQLKEKVRVFVSAPLFSSLFSCF